MSEYETQTEAESWRAEVEIRNGEIAALEEDRARLRTALTAIADADLRRTEAGFLAKIAKRALGREVSGVY